MGQDISHASQEEVSFVCWKTVEETRASLQIHQAVIQFLLAKVFSYSLLYSNNIYILLDGLSYNTRGYFASCVVFFRAPQGRGKMRAMSKMSASIIC